MVEVKEYKKEKNPFKLFADHLEAIATGLKYMIRPQRVTLMYPESLLELPTGYRGMIRLYKDVCIGCTLCAMICPADAMKMVTEGGKKFPQINYGRCVFCGFCVDVCPVDALKDTKVHDTVFTSKKDLVFDPDRFDKDYSQPPLVEKPVRRVKAIIDENKGIKYVPTD